jgi:hypothetical protein
LPLSEKTLQAKQSNTTNAKMRLLLPVLFILGSVIALPLALPGMRERGLSADVAHLDIGA